jgi:hypothetical protein
MPEFCQKYLLRYIDINTRMPSSVPNFNQYIIIKPSIRAHPKYVFTAYLYAPIGLYTSYIFSVDCIGLLFLTKFIILKL